MGCVFRFLMVFLLLKKKKKLKKKPQFPHHFIDTKMRLTSEVKWKDMMFSPEKN
jgi:hypothetical protein